jgi:hypothetical protein
MSYLSKKSFIKTKCILNTKTSGRHAGQVDDRDLGHQSREGRPQRVPQVRRKSIRGRKNGHRYCKSFL